MREKRVKEQGQTLSLWIDQDVYKQVERLAKKVGITRSHMAANLLQAGLDDALLLDKTGILTAALKIAQLKENMQRELDKLKEMEGLLQQP